MLSESTWIDRTINHVYGAFADIAGWKGVLPDVLDVRVLYDDGAHQEFLMTVERPPGPETVRGIRFCRAPYRIAMFQPAPPPGFRKMVGLWTFAEDDARRTRVTAARWFELDRSTGLDRVMVADKLRGYLRANLDLFRRSLEAGS
jgi:hypothetical protein